MIVKDIVKEYLIKKGFDGLFQPGECACLVSDLVPCCGSMDSCEPGYKKETPNDTDGYGWEIGREKPTNPLATEKKDDY
ncbi:MAG: hypothetical protein KAJ01_07055 [Candidatus Hydrogenedentes bacterium]|nr:hypothetical protein [Candidatus Hydrogenedentota bacterium]